MNGGSHCDALLPFISAKYVAGDSSERPRRFPIVHPASRYSGLNSIDIFSDFKTAILLQ